MHSKFSFIIFLIFTSHFDQFIKKKGKCFSFNFFNFFICRFCYIWCLKCLFQFFEQFFTRNLCTFSLSDPQNGRFLTRVIRCKTRNVGFHKLLDKNKNILQLDPQNGRFLTRVIRCKPGMQVSINCQTKIKIFYNLIHKMDDF